MLGRNSLWVVGAVVAGLMLPSQAMAKYDAHTRVDLNLRVGPGIEYGVIDVIPAGYPVEVYGCLEAYEWCDINWDGLRGWVSARYLVQPGTTVYLPQYAPRIGVPIITFSFVTYHDRYYRDRPWYRERHGRWSGREWRDRDGDRRRGDGGRDRDRDQVEERQEAQPPRRQRDVEQPRQQVREARPPRQQVREARPTRQQEREARPTRQQEREARPPRQQEREARPPRQPEREARPQQQEREARPQQGDRTQRVQRRGDGVPLEELRRRRQ